jgi:hypothetical protein
MLGITQPHLNELLDLGVIPCRHVGNELRVRVADLLEHKERSDRQKAALLAIAEINNETDDGWVS